MHLQLKKKYMKEEKLFLRHCAQLSSAISNAAVAECVRRKFLYPNFAVKYSSTPFKIIIDVKLLFTTFSKYLCVF